MPGRTAVKLDASVTAKTSAASAQTESARSELSRWVSGGIRFHVHCESDGYVEAYRIGEEAALDRLLARNITPVGEIDLHGATVSEVETKVLAFVQARARVGPCALRIVHGKGTRSENGEQLRSEVHRVLEHGSVATFIRAFSTAPRNLGGAGATLVWVRMPP